MTAIFLYIDEERANAAIAADDREGVSGSKRDKIHIIGDRYCVGALGHEMTLWAMDPIEHLFRRDHRLPDNLETFASTVHDLNRLMCERRHSFLSIQRQRNLLSEERWQALKKSASKYVVFDIQTMRASLVDMGSSIPPTGLFRQPNITEFRPGIVHCLGLASVLYPAGQTTLPTTYRKNPMAFLVSSLQKLKSEDGRVGDPGATVKVIDRQLAQYRSCFRTHADFILAYHPERPEE